MNGKEYMQTQIEIVNIGVKTQLLDLDGFLKCIRNAETTAPILDPTLFIKARENLEALKKLAEKLSEVKKLFENLQQAVVSTSMAYNVDEKK